jgi:hypothetical protein
MSGSFSDLTFTTCCYLTSTTSPRAKIVKKCFDTWESLLSLDFAQKCFVDDRSTNSAGINILKETKIAEAFDVVYYVPFSHPPHSNFGIVYSYDIAITKYILHIDDDVIVAGTHAEISNLIERAILILETDPSILGINLLNLSNPMNEQMRWAPSKAYDHDTSNTFCHPVKYFGTCAGIIRRELLGRLSLRDVIAYGANQPAHWEKIISKTSDEFLVINKTSPFSVPPEAWKIQATKKKRRNAHSKVRHLLNLLHR